MGPSPTLCCTTPSRGSVWVAKVPSTPQDQSLGVVDGIRAIARDGQRPARADGRDPARHDGGDERRAREAGSARRAARVRRLSLDPAPGRGVDPGAAVRLDDLREARADRRRSQDTRALDERVGSDGVVLRELDVDGRPHGDRGAARPRGRGAHRVADELVRQPRARARGRASSPPTRRRCCRSRSRRRSCPSSANTSAPSRP